MSRGEAKGGHSSSACKSRARAIAPVRGKEGERNSLGLGAEVKGEESGWDRRRPRPFPHTLQPTCPAPLAPPLTPPLFLPLAPHTCATLLADVVPLQPEHKPRPPSCIQDCPIASWRVGGARSSKSPAPRSEAIHALITAMQQCHRGSSSTSGRSSLCSMRLMGAAH